MSGYQKGKFIQEKFNEITKKYESSDESLMKATALKYQNFLSWRKYNFLAQTMDFFYDPSKKTWLPRNKKVNGIIVKEARQISHNRMEAFAQSLDIGDVYNIPGHVGCVRPLTSRVVVMTDPCLRLPYLRDKLMWFKDEEGLFVIQFSDDGAPETKNLSMSLGTLTFWNFGPLVRNRSRQYLLHALSVNEKDAAMADL